MSTKELAAYIWDTHPLSHRLDRCQSILRKVEYAHKDGALQQVDL
jgi:hypothetical protein